MERWEKLKAASVYERALNDELYNSRVAALRLIFIVNGLRMQPPLFGFL